MMSYTCISCHVAFADSGIQREHYKSDWHRYNLKRKVADLPPVTADSFRQRVLAQQQACQGAEVQSNSTYCSTCRKKFGCAKALENHAKSKKHQAELLAYYEKETKRELKKENKKNAEMSAGKQEQMSGMSPAEGNDEEVEEVDSDEWDEFDDDPISINDCLFCPHHSSSIDKNLAHMTERHSFFIPDIEFVVDLEGLLRYLGEKVGQGHVCLWCNEKGHHFHSVQAVQKHMVDKGHTKILHVGAVLLEYIDFYDYSSSYPDTMEAGEDEMVPNVITNEGFHITLPSGAVIGHRSLMRYYRQHVNPRKAEMMAQSRQSIRGVLSQYNAIGWKQSTAEATYRKAKDMGFLQRFKSKHHLHLGVKSNKLQTHFRSQIGF